MRARWRRHGSGRMRPKPDLRHRLPVNLTKQYIDVLWKHQGNEDPVRLVSELGEDRYELRKLEFFPDGTVDAADSNRETPRTRLGVGAVPSPQSRRTTTWRIATCATVLTGKLFPYSGYLENRSSYMDELERLRAESKRLDELVGKVSSSDRQRAALSIRNELLRRGATLSSEDEKMLDAFAKNEADLTSLAQQFQDRL